MNVSDCTLYYHFLMGTEELKKSNFLQVNFFTDLSGDQGLFQENGWAPGGGLMVMFLLLLLIYSCSRVLNWFRMEKKSAGTAGKNHPAIPATFYPTPEIPKRLQGDAPGPEDELAKPDDYDTRGDPEVDSSFSQLDQIS